MPGSNSQQVKNSRSTGAKDARLLRNNKHIDLQLPELPANSEQDQWETIAERTSDSTYSAKEIKEMAWVLDLRRKGYSLRRIEEYTGIRRSRVAEWREMDSVYRAELEGARNDWLDEKVEALIPLAEKTMRGRKVRTNKAGQKMYDRAEQEAVRLVSDITMKLASRENPKKWGGLGEDSSAGVILQINMPEKNPALEGKAGEWGDDQAGQAARLAALSFTATAAKPLPLPESTDEGPPPQGGGSPE